MRTILIAAFLLFATAASAGEPGELAPPLRLAQDIHKEAVADPGKLSLSRSVPHWAQDELLGEALGHWLGVHNGRWDMFAESLAVAGESGPTIAGTVRKNAAEIQLRWHPGE